MNLRLMVIEAFLLLPVIIYYADYFTDDNDVDCFDNKFNHVLIFCGAIVLIVSAVMCFVLFYNDKFKKE